MAASTQEKHFQDRDILIKSYIKSRRWRVPIRSLHCAILYTIVCSLRLSCEQFHAFRVSEGANSVKPPVRSSTTQLRKSFKTSISYRRIIFSTKGRSSFEMPIIHGLLSIVRQNSFIRYITAQTERLLDSFVGKRNGYDRER